MVSESFRLKTRLIIFDFDGTLADTSSVFIAALNGAAERFGFRRCEPGDVKRLRHLDSRGVLKALGISTWKIPLMASHMRSAMGAEAERIKLFEGIDSLLERLVDRGVVLAIATSNCYENVSRILGKRNTTLVRHYECDAGIFGKSRKFKRILAKSGISAGEAIAIGDEVRDLDAAKEAGIPFGAVSWGYNAPEALLRHGPSVLFNTPEEIFEKIVTVD